MTQFANPAPARSHLPLLEAIQQWCDPSLIAQVKEQEAYASDTTLLSLHVPPLDGAPALSSRRVAPDGIRPADIKNRLWKLWDLLIDDFKHRVTARQIYLCGVRLKPTKETAPQPIPSEWASTFRVQARAGTISSGEDQFGDIMVSKLPGLPPHEPGTTGDGAVPLRVAGAELGRRTTVEDWATVDVSAFDVATLTAEQVAVLLERHACFVRKDIGVSLLPPGKASPMALVATKMQDRAKAGEMEDSLSAEARWLAAWVKSAAPAYQPLTDKTIRAKLPALFKRLRQAKPPQT